MMKVLSLTINSVSGYKGYLDSKPSPKDKFPYRRRHISIREDNPLYKEIVTYIEKENGTDKR